MTFAASINFDKRTEAFLRRAEKAYGKEAVYEALDKEFGRLAARAAAHVIRTKVSGQRLGVRSGTLRRSIVGRSVRINGFPTIRVGVIKGPALKYAAVQEVGTKGANPESPIPTIRPKKGKALAIPLDPVKTRAGVARFNSPRQQPNLKFVPFRSSGVAVGALYTKEEMEKLKGNPSMTLRDIQASWLLLRKVDIPPKYFIRDGMLEMMPQITKEIADFLARYVAEAEDPS